MRFVVKTAKTVEEAVELAIKELGIDRLAADITVMQEPTKGLFGFLGGSDAVVKVKAREVKEDMNFDDIFAEAGFNTKESVDDFDMDNEDLDVEEEVYLEDINEDEEDFDLPSEEVEAFEPEPIVEEPVVEETTVEEKIEEALSHPEEDTEDDISDLYEEGYEPDFDTEEEVEEEEEDHPVYTSDEASLINTSELEFSGSAPLITSEDDLEQVAQKAKKILEDILVKMHISAKVSYETVRDSVINLNLVDISENDTGIVIGAKGETLNAIQYVLSLLVNKDSNKFYRTTVNVGDYRDRRKKSIEANAQRVAYKVLKTKKSIALKPMNSFERRIVHYSLQDYKEIETVSTGKFPNRKVVIKYKGF